MTSTPGVGGTVPVAIAVAVPEVSQRRRIAGLFAATEADLAGETGTIMGSDRGDATHSFTGPVGRAPSVTRAVNQGGATGTFTTTSEVQDTLGDNPSRDPYRRMLWRRMVNR